MYRTLIWDWNGTLFNDACLCREVMNSILAKRNLTTMSKARYENLFDFPVTAYYQKLGFDFQRETFESLGNEFMAAYEMFRHRSRLQPGAHALIERMHRQGVQQAVLSAYRQDTLEAILQEKRLTDRFSPIVGARDHFAHGKMDQGRWLINQVKHSKREVLLIGDTQHDFHVAEHMGIDCALVYGGHQSLKRLIVCGCPVFQSLRHLSTWLSGDC